MHLNYIDNFRIFSFRPKKKLTLLMILNLSNKKNVHQ